MRPSRSQRATAVLVSAALALGPASASAQPPEPAPAAASAPASEATAAVPPDQAAALAHFREGKEHYAERRYAEAAAAFERSLAAVWTINAAYNAAASHDRAGDLVTAMQAYRRYLAAAAPDDEHRVTAETRSEELRALVGEVQLQIDDADEITEIRVNGAVVPPDAGPWLTLPGPLAVEFAGASPAQRVTVRAEVRPGGTATIVFPGFPPPPIVTPPIDAPQRPPPVVVRPPTRRQNALRAAFWTSAGLSAASGVAVGVLGALALYYKGRFERPVCPDGVMSCPDDAAEQGARKPEFAGAVRRYETATNAMVGVAAVFGVTALALGIVALRDRPRRQVTTRARLRWTGPAVQLTF